MYGEYFVDWTEARMKNGMPPAAYGREHAMSDRLQALLSSPFFLVKSAAAWLYLKVSKGKILFVFGILFEYSWNNTPCLEQ